MKTGIHTGALADGRSPESDRMRVEVRDTELPVSARALSTLPRIDYTDAFRLTTPRASRQTAEQWARAALEGAPPSMRAMLRRGWFALGLRLGSSDDRRRVLGWEIRRRSPEFVGLAARSLIGMEAELLFKREPDALLFATVLKLNNPLVRVFWGAFSPQHRRVVRHLLREVGRREG